MITWDDSILTGVPEIDGQHKELVEKYNEFSAVMSNRMLRMDQASEMLDFLQFYTVWHFEREEELFERYNCPAAAANKKAHAQFIKMFGQFYEQWQAQGLDSALVQATYTELGNWIANHIRHMDTQLQPYVKES
ncbi:bacteriohemerythrin [Chloroflexota bacterium]